jgi:hypothetical protein
MLNNVTDGPVEYVVEVPAWVVEIHALLAPLLLPAALLGAAVLAAGVTGIVRHRRAQRADETVVRETATTGASQ